MPLLPSPPDSAYGASVDGVRALLPMRTITTDPTSRPTEGQVFGWLEDWAAEVRGRVGNLELVADSARRADMVRLARKAVHYRTAADAEASGGPETVGEDGTTSYARWLVAQYEAVMARLGAMADAERTDDDPGEGVGMPSLEEPAWSFPPSSAISTRPL